MNHGKVNGKCSLSHLSDKQDTTVLNSFEYIFVDECHKMASAEKISKSTFCFVRYEVKLASDLAKPKCTWLCDGIHIAIFIKLILD